MFSNQLERFCTENLGNAIGRDATEFNASSAVVIDHIIKSFTFEWFQFWLGKSREKNGRKLASSTSKYIKRIVKENIFLF